jgi:diguanylate cyclase (GGDEF)-like protein/PAS domain S-box-containing protein
VRHNAENGAPAAGALFETAFSGAPVGIALISLEGVFLRVNPELCRMLDRVEQELIGSTSRPFTHPDDLELTDAAYVHLTSVDTPLSVEKRYVRPDGRVVWADTRGVAILDAAGRPSHIVSHFLDVTARKLAEQQSVEARQDFEAAFTEAPIGMAIVGLDGRFMKVNRTLCELTGYTEDQFQDVTFHELTHPDDLESHTDHMQRLLAGRISRFVLEKRYFTADRREIWVKLAISLVRDVEGQPLHFVSQTEDISERRRLEAALQHLADHDPLTGVWNRRRFQAELQHQIDRGQRYGDSAALLLLDVDRFKSINDTHGHAAGDQLLKSVAAELQGRLRTTDSIARLGGDEFAIILGNISSAQADHVAAGIAEQVAATTIKIGDAELSATVSIGVAFINEHKTPAAALRQADLAMYQVKLHRQSTARDLGPGRDETA